MIEKFIQKIEELFPNKDSFGKDDFKFIWMMTFGYKPDRNLKKQIFTETRFEISKNDLYDLIRSEWRFLDKESHEMLMVSMIDKNQKGYISELDLTLMLTSNDMSCQRAVQIFRQLDKENLGKITYSTFLTAVRSTLL